MAKSKATVQRLGYRVMVYVGEEDVKLPSGMLAKKNDGSLRKLQVWRDATGPLPTRFDAGLVADALKAKGLRTHVEGVRANIEPLAGRTFEFKVPKAATQHQRANEPVAATMLSCLVRAAAVGLLQAPTLLK
jgi:hypothetical protein